ncbi:MULTISPECIES: hypothetical protein [unclassified Rathayibacter]|uniref:hypothetical protein n=1 Tax=unclassified Rathayibacter TaxID=2609250 RepID=UPI00104F68B7|nr:MULTISPECIES: hypothetical protein [unclassified Rathayibacter]TCL85817.1 hypothetical protein EDF49_101486 [Rathayibacter sp. PhB192]TCM31638.1 hypothetical protein EDF43_101486 [Rathayibacter sp. PhB179]
MPEHRPARARVLALAWTAVLVMLFSTIAPSPAQASSDGTKITLTGTIRTIVADPIALVEGTGQPLAHSEEYQKVLLVGERAYELDGDIAVNNLVARVVGRLVGNRIAALSVTPLSSPDSARATGSLGALPASGTTRVLTMLAYWTAPDSVTPAQAAAQMYDDSSSWFRDASYSALGQTGDVTPWMKIAGPTGGCYAGGYSILAQAKEAAVAAGFDLASYDNYVVYFPRCYGDASDKAGWATVGAPNTWLNGYMDRRVTVHEQGHNYGLWHSHSNLCSGGGLLGDCTMSDYGDPYDAMGSSTNVGHFNASQKTLLGWLDGRTADLTAGGTATLVPMADDSTATHAAVVRREDGTSYWLEYRQPFDFDSWLPWHGTEGVLVHASGAASGSLDSGASLIDVRPEDGISTFGASLLPGQSWTSSDGLIVSVGQITSAGATVTVGNATTVSGPIPTISGEGSVGQTLTAAPGTWVPAPVDLSYQWRRNGVVIGGATASTYQVIAADAGTALSVSVTGTKTGLLPSTMTSSSTTIKQALQTLMPTPTISGSTTVGSTLTANPGTWDSGVTLSYQWKKNNGVYISGATAKTYVLKASDAGATLTVSVTGTKTGYSPATKTSATTAAVTNGAVITGATPTITGTATVGQKLTAVPGTWTPSPVTLAYQWQRNGTAISGATATTYTLVAADAGAAITVAVTGTKSGYTAVTKTSAAVTAKAALQTLMPTPTITGTTKVGSTLTANPGTWDAGTTLSYQWKKNGGTYISGATAKTYVLKASDAGATITVSVTSTKTGYSPATKTSATTAVVTGGVLTGATPTITGTAKVGQTLTAVPGTWSPAPVTLSYQWKRGGTAISGATSATYKTVSADAGKAITVTVTGTKAGYTTLSKTSAAKTVVK